MAILPSDEVGFCSSIVILWLLPGTRLRFLDYSRPEAYYVFVTDRSTFGGDTMLIGSTNGISSFTALFFNLLLFISSVESW